MALAEIDPFLWRAIVGNGSHSRLPLVNSIVNYFPQGQFEHSSTNYCFESCHTFCFVVNINFCCHPPDELFARITLMPVLLGLLSIPPVRVDPQNSGDIIALTVKVRPVDVLYEGPDLYTIPKNVAQTILPTAGDYQIVTMTDVHGMSWQFEYIYAAQIRRYYFMYGWFNFANRKGLRVDDSVVFMRRQSTGELFIGVRRRFVREEMIPHLRQSGWAALQRTYEGNPFIVDYYPNGESPAFVVDTAAVANNMCNEDLVVGTRIKMRLQDGDWEEGTVANWCYEKGFWRSLQVTWDKPLMNTIARYRFVNPWNVEICR